MRYCPVCQSRFPNFLPLPLSYIESAARLNVAYSLEDFETLNVGQYSCPACFSSDRDRLYALYVEHMLKPTVGLRVLEIAPAHGLSLFLRSIPGVSYRSADLFSPLAMDKVDIMDMVLYDEGMFDFVVCSHVLEHVKDDRAALRELWRVLAPGGRAILMVPILTTSTETEEDPDEQDPEQRVRRFGQDDHVRMYAQQDFLARIAAAGFDVDVLGEAEFVRASGQSLLFNEQGVTPHSVLYVGRKPVSKHTARDTPQLHVTIAIPAYKHQFFEHALKSALSQEGVNFEIVICDDSDGGEIEQIASRLSHETNFPIRYQKNPERLGEIGNARRCIEESRGRFIKLLYDDDVLMPGCLRRQAAVLKNRPDIAVVSSRRINIDADGLELPDYLPSYYPFDGDCCLNGKEVVNFLGTHTVNFIGEPVVVMFRRDDAMSLIEGGIFSLQGQVMKWFGDLTFYVNLLRKGHLAMLADPLAKFRISSIQYSQEGRDNPGVGNYWRDQFQCHLRDLGWSGSPTDFIGVRALSAPLGSAFRSFDLVDRWRRWLERDSKSMPAIGSAYGRWLADRRVQLRRAPVSLCQREAGLCISVAVSSVGGDSEALQATRESLLAQTCPPDLVRFIPPREKLSVEELDGWTLLLCAGDVLEPHALQCLHDVVQDGLASSAVIVYFDHDEWDGFGSRSPSFKPQWNPDLLLGFPYIGRTVLVRNDWAQQYEAGDDLVFDLAYSYRLALSASLLGSDAVVHVPQILAHLAPSTPHQFVVDSAAWQRLALILSQHLSSAGSGAVVHEGPGPGTFHAVFPLTRSPKVSLIIPIEGQAENLGRCLESLLEKTAYSDFEILVVASKNQTNKVNDFLRSLALLGERSIRVLRDPVLESVPQLCNLAVTQAQGEFVLLLNCGIVAIHSEWLSHMARHALRDGVGIVGARLLYPEGTLQHAGIIMGLRGPAAHPFLGLKSDEPGYMFRAQLTQNFSAVTAACMLVSKALYEEVGGLDEDTFAGSFNEVDFCLRVGRTGRRIVWTPLATLLHEGSACQKADIENLANENKSQRFTQEQAAMYERWPEVIANDPAYNPNLSLVERGYEVETNPLLCHDPLKGLVDHRVVAFAADAFGCGNYRILQPMQSMLDSGLCSGGASPELFGPNLALRSGADTLVFQRPSSDGDLALLESLLPLKNIKKIYEVDDDLSRVPMKSAHREHIPKDIRARMIRNIGLCDRLVVSTDTLAHQLRGSNDDIRVVLNRLPPAMWGAAPPDVSSVEQSARKPRVGWAGGISHRGDLELIAQVVRDTADQVDWIFFGMCPDAIRPYVKEFYAGVPTLDYPKRLIELTQSWDLAVAPLEINPFNEAKSNLRLLEYGWCGLPVVCSDITPYQSELPVRRVKNRYKDWRAAILDAVSEQKASREMGQLLQQRVQAEWMLTGDNLRGWYEAWTGD